MPDYGDITINKRVNQNCVIKRIFYCGPDVAELAAKELRPTLDPDIIHHTNRNDESSARCYDEIETESKAEAFDRDGKKTNLKRTGTTFRARQDVTKETTDHYFGLGDQDVMTT